MERREILPFLHRLQKECGGTIPFERFMQEALYHPDFGYYTANIRDVGTRGDFSTSATLGDELGTAVAAWIENRIREFGWDRGWKRIPVIEVGAGNGSLAKAVLRKLNWKLRWRLDYMIHETSPVLRHRQKNMLRWQGVRWITSPSKALIESKGEALIFSNELVDAFPCRIFEKYRDGWDEIGIRISDNGSLSETRFSPITPFPDLDHFSPLPEGQRVEVHESYRAWLDEWRLFWKKGELLTVDYGDTFENLYSRRASGSIRGYWNHERITGSQIYARFGKQDLTADVNFSDLMQWGKEFGWKTISLATQAEFLDRWLASTSGAVKNSKVTPHRQEVHESFKILEQRPCFEGVP